MRVDDKRSFYPFLTDGKFKEPIIIIDQLIDAGSLRYEPGLSRVEEPVISSHFMEGLARDESLRLYDPEDFYGKQIKVDRNWVNSGLIPSLLRASRRFAEHRAALAPPRARQHFQKYGVTRPGEIGIEHEITEALFDKQFLRGPRETCSRQTIAAQIKAIVEVGDAITMVIPALPFKFSSPLKSRGPDPDLGEINFLLTLVEIVWTVENIYRAARPGVRGTLARFIVVSDGSRFNEIVGEAAERLQRYRNGLAHMIDALGIEDHVTIVDYLEVVKSRLPEPLLQAKCLIAKDVRRQYSELMWPVFDPRAMDKTLRAIAAIEPDPECNNHYGRFVSLLKSLIFTVNYKSLKAFEAADQTHFGDRKTGDLALYREITAHLFHPYGVAGDRDCARGLHCDQQSGQFSLRVREDLRIAMLSEAWRATIDYLAEIKSDRDLAVDPIVVAFPNCLRWTIHPKAGQLALSTSHMLGTSIQCWAGSGALRRTKEGLIMLCTLPALVLEGRGARPVVVTEPGSAETSPPQPLFYLDPSISIDGTGALLVDLDKNLTRLKSR